MEYNEIIIRFLITFFAGLLFGLERQRSHKPIGFGTFIFVAVGSCALSIIAIIIVPENPLPLLGAIVTGIGFLGAGALIRTTDKIFGFTTAAAIWIFAILGLIIGLGQYFIAGIIYISIWLIVIVDRFLEMKGIGSYQRKIIITTNKIINDGQIRSIFNKNSINYKVIDYCIEKSNKKLNIAMLIEGKKESINHLPQDLIKEEWVETCKIE
ncbi:MAG: MgtC/SapB family protein [Nanoarchaeota archaeon]|nr:MgtC/SapB family protein [Nanoarchaeota archaeon]MBU1631764.1 MgtC/SapB family protein [Nanoarchaeota archaeon]MBU1876164.1 MgtC/SapB family protein [Nanoarchaeota archaeon]